jgi:hypothetical protein
MKKIFTLSMVGIVAIILTGCIKENIGFNENYWLSKERGVVVYSDYCRYYVVHTAYGYTILRAPGNYQPYEGATVYGNFSNYGYRDFYNRSSGFVFSAEVVEYWLTYTQAQMAIYYYCPYGKNQIKKPDTDSVATQ